MPTRSNKGFNYLNEFSKHTRYSFIGLAVFISLALINSFLFGYSLWLLVTSVLGVMLAIAAIIVKLSYKEPSLPIPPPVLPLNLPTDCKAISKQKLERRAKTLFWENEVEPLCPSPRSYSSGVLSDGFSMRKK